MKKHFAFIIGLLFGLALRLATRKHKRQRLPQIITMTYRQTNVN
jgi:hypothetical protein